MKKSFKEAEEILAQAVYLKFKTGKNIEDSIFTNFVEKLSVYDVRVLRSFYIHMGEKRADIQRFDGMENPYQEIYDEFLAILNQRLDFLNKNSALGD